MQAIVQLRELAARGVVVEVEIRGLARLELPATLEELGIPTGDPRGVRLRPGRRILVPPELHRRLRGAAERMREAVRSRSLRLVSAMLGGGYYIPEAAVSAVREEFEKARADFDAAREELLLRLPEIRAEAERMMEAVARRAWRASARIRKAFRENPEAFREALLARVRERLDEEGIRRIRAELRVAGLLLISDLEEERARAEMARARAEAEREIQRLRVEEARELLLREARQALERDLAPLRAVLVEIRARLYQEAREILGLLNERGHLHPRVRERLLRLADDLSALNVLRDPDIEHMLRRIREAAARCPAAARGRPRPGEGVDPEAAAAAVREALEQAIEATREDMAVYRGVAMEIE